MIKEIEFNLRDAIACINATSLTTMKLFMSSPPFIKINWVGLTVEEKYNTLLQVFEGCKEGVPMPANPSQSRAKLDNFGFASWKTFFEGGYHCAIALDVDARQYEFTPEVYMIRENGLYGMKSGIEHIASTATPEEFITTLERVLAKIPALTEEYYQQEDEESEDEN